MKKTVSVILVVGLLFLISLSSFAKMTTYITTDENGKTWAYHIGSFDANADVTDAGVYVNGKRYSINGGVRINADKDYSDAVDQAKGNEGKYGIGLYLTEYENESYTLQPYYTDANGETKGELETILLSDSGYSDGETTILSTSSGTAEIPQGVIKKADTELSLTMTTLSESESGIVIDEGEEMSSMDIHVEGISENNTTPIIVTIPEGAPVGLNNGNLSLYHVEDGKTVKMTEVATRDDLTDHNQFAYNPADGTLVLSLATFSEIAMVSETDKEWKGEIDFSWYNKDASELQIANADQLVAFGKLVGGMAKEYGFEQDEFNGKTITLISDINLADAEENNTEKIFYPIGYYYTEDKNDDGVAGDYYSTVYSFEGIFDGNGNTIKNFYQETWEIKGDYDGNYYKDGMGLFGYVYNGTVKNLTVENFSSTGEFTPTGCVAAYSAGNSTFENISVFNCNPRVYNTGNGGIVGISGDSEESENTVTYRNITVDQSNKISALWGSYDVSCGGIVGWDRGLSKIVLDNCRVAAHIDVNNDVCANYQYYVYRYSGMFIGSVRYNTTDANGSVVAKTDHITATNCEYTMGDWNEYWYCELVANSLASYTHDHQFSRLTTINDVSEIKDGENWTKAGNFVIPNEDNSGAECYHIMIDSNGALYRHFHDVEDESNPEVYETFDLNGDGELNDLKEDRQCYFIPFNQLFNGYGYGVKPTYEFEGMNENPDAAVKSEVKFITTGLKNVGAGEPYNVSDLFSAIDGVDISSPSVSVFVSPAEEGVVVGGKYVADIAKWGDGTITFSGSGLAKVSVTDYYYCKTTTTYINVVSSEITNANATLSSISINDYNTEFQDGIYNYFIYGIEDELDYNTVEITVIPSFKGSNVVTEVQDIEDENDLCVGKIYSFTVTSKDKTVTNKYTVRISNSNIQYHICNQGE